MLSQDNTKDWKKENAILTMVEEINREKGRKAQHWMERERKVRGRRSEMREKSKARGDEW